MQHGTSHNGWYRAGTGQEQALPVLGTELLGIVLYPVARLILGPVMLVPHEAVVPPLVLPDDGAVTW